MKEAAEDVGHSEFFWVMKELVGQNGTEKEMECFDLQAYFVTPFPYIVNTKSFCEFL